MTNSKTESVIKGTMSIVANDYRIAIKRLYPSLLGRVIGTMLWCRWKHKPLRPALSKVFSNWTAGVNGYVTALSDQRLLDRRRDLVETISGQITKETLLKKIREISMKRGTT